MEREEQPRTKEVVRVRDGEHMEQQVGHARQQATTPFPNSPTTNDNDNDNNNNNNNNNNKIISR